MARAGPWLAGLVIAGQVEAGHNDEVGERQPIFENGAVEICDYADERVVWLKRKAGRMTSGELVAAGEALAAWMDSHCEGRALILDPRAAVGRNDAEFEAEVLRFRELVWSKFRGVVHLVRTEIGRMQVQRMNDGPRSSRAVTSDEAEAMRLASEFAA